MKTLKLLVEREHAVQCTGKETYTPGRMYADGIFFCHTCEDEDRCLEDGGEKVYGRTAIPKGTYRITLSFSHRFQKLLPEVHDVPGFSGVRIHGGNAAEDSLGCILIGQVRTSAGIAQCAATVQRLIGLLQAAEDRGDEVTLEIR